MSLEIMSQFAGETNTQNVYAMFYGGLRGSSYVKREEPDYTFEQVTEWVDSLYASKQYDVIKEVEKALTETNLYKSMVQPETKKKKAH